MSCLIGNVIRDSTNECWHKGIESKKPLYFISFFIDARVYAGYPQLPWLILLIKRYIIPLNGLSLTSSLNPRLV